MAYAPDLSLIDKIEKCIQFVKWIPITYILTSVPCMILFRIKFLSYKFQIPTIILTLMVNKITIDYYTKKLENDKSHRKKMIFDIIDVD